MAPTFIFLYVRWIIKSIMSDLNDPLSFPRYETPLTESPSNAILFAAKNENITMFHMIEELRI